MIIKVICKDGKIPPLGSEGPIEQQDGVFLYTLPITNLEDLLDLAATDGPFLLENGSMGPSIEILT
jgi:hypothetical protein